MGLAYPTIQERQVALEEAIGIIRPLLRGETVTFAGTHHQADGVVLRPPPVQQPYIPLLIAGGGERTTLRYVAQYADMSSMAAVSWAGGAYTLADAAHKFQVLQRRCEEAGRPYGSILRSTLFSPLILAETPAAIQAKLDQLQNKTSSPATKPSGNSFLGAGQTAGNAPTAADVNDVKADAQKQQQELQEHLAKLK